MNLTIPFPASEQLDLSIHFSHNVITDIGFVSQQKTSTKAANYCLAYEQENSDFAEKIRQEIATYLSNAEHRFSLPCQLDKGTEYQHRVWQALMKIPAGQVKTYGALAKELNSSARAIGNACRRNPFPLIVPCHRIVSARGIGGYAGDTEMHRQGDINFLQIKHWLLAHEKAHD